MNHLSSPPSSSQNVHGEQWTEKIQESIHVLLNWIDSVGIQTESCNQTRRNPGFTNGPFAEIKELIGTPK